MGKLYCSSKCKQFGYNHKEKIFHSESISGIGINAKSQTFYLEDFQFYNIRRKMLKRYKELCYKKARWELAENEIINCKRLEFPVKDYTWETFNLKKLSESEEYELYELETNIEDEIMMLNT